MTRGEKSGRINTDDAAIYADEKEYPDCILFYRLGDFL